MKSIMKESQVQLEKELIESITDELILNLRPANLKIIVDNKLLSWKNDTLEARLQYVSDLLTVSQLSGGLIRVSLIYERVYKLNPSVSFDHKAQMEKLIKNGFLKRVYGVKPFGKTPYIFVGEKTIS